MKQKDPDIVYALRRRIEGRSVFNRLLVEKETIRSAVEALESLRRQLAADRADLTDVRMSLELARKSLAEKSAQTAALAAKADEAENRLRSALVDIEGLTAKLDELRQSVASSACKTVGRRIAPLGRECTDETAPAHKRRVLIVGWFGAQNFGDELMLKCMLDRFEKEGEDVEISVLIEKNDGYRFLNIPGSVRCFYPPETESDLASACRYFDEFILAGGAHIDDTPIKSFDFIPYLIVRLSLEALRLGKTVRWIAASANRAFSDPDYVRALKTISDEAAVFSVRDAFSLGALERIGVRNASFERDLAFDIEPVIHAHEKIAIVTLVDFAGRKFLEPLAADLFAFFAGRMERTGEKWRLCFLPFYLTKSCDRKLFEKLLSAVDTQGVPHFIAEEIESVETMLMLFRAADLTVSMRYHAALLADLFGMPNLVICPDSHRHYFNKMHALAASYPEISRLIDASAYVQAALFTNLRHLADQVDAGRRSGRTDK